MIHHLLSHSDTADWLKVNQFFVEQLGYIARKLDAIQEGERTALDNSMIMLCSSMMTGGHNNDQLSVVMVGRGGGRIDTGRVLDYRGKPNRQMCRMYLSMMDKMGVRPKMFGDAVEPLTSAARPHPTRTTDFQSVATRVAQRTWRSAVRSAHPKSSL